MPDMDEYDESEEHMQERADNDRKRKREDDMIEAQARKEEKEVPQISPEITIEVKRIANTILNQLGAPALRMIGAKEFRLIYPDSEHQGGVLFRIGKNKHGYNSLKIRLTWTDLYMMDFLRYEKRKVVKGLSEPGIYFDQMRSTIRTHTGLETRLPVIKGLK